MVLENSLITDNSAFWAGGIDNATTGKVKVLNSEISRNVASYSGGGISNDGTMIIAESTISDNQGYNGGIANQSGAMMTISQSTISGNRATYGGGFLNLGTLIAQETTITGNAAHWGGGVDSEGTTYLSQCTIVDNTANYGGGISNTNMAVLVNCTVAMNHGVNGGGILTSTNEESATTLVNTIVAGNVTGDGVPTDLEGKPLTATSLYNLIGDELTAGGLTNGTQGNIVGVDSKRVLRTGLLDNNGGPTQTLALSHLTNNPALNVGAALATLVGAIDDSTTTLNVTSTAFVVGESYQIDQEILTVTAIDNTTLTVVRGQAGTVATMPCLAACAGGAWLSPFSSSRTGAGAAIAAACVRINRLGRKAFFMG